MKNFDLIRVTDKEIPDLLSLIKGIAEFEKLLHEVTATEELLSKTLLDEKRNSTEAYLIKINEEIIGYTLFFHNYSTFLGKKGIYIEDIYIIPEHRSKGYGKEVFKFIAKIAKDRDCGRIEWSVLNWNKPAINFYDGIGAVPMNEWTVYRMTEEARDKFIE